MVTYSETFIVPRHYSREHHYFICSFFKRLIDSICDEINSTLPNSFTYILYMNKYDMEQEISFVNDDIKDVLRQFILLVDETHMLFQRIGDNRFVIFLQSIDEKEGTRVSLLDFTYHVIVEMQKEGLVKNFSTRELKMISEDVIGKVMHS
jgi:hypothetical protein